MQPREVPPAVVLLELPLDRIFNEPVRIYPQMILRLSTQYEHVLFSGAACFFMPAHFKLYEVTVLRILGLRSKHVCLVPSSDFDELISHMRSYVNLG